MKTKRQALIEQIVMRQRIGTQEELLAALRREGMDATQATLSRDLRELRLSKVAMADGGYGYAVPGRQDSGPTPRERQVISKAVLSLAASGSLLVIHVLPGMARAVARWIDALPLPDVLGSVAGTDTVLLVVKAPDGAERAAAQLRRRLAEERNLSSIHLFGGH
ncbi:arginine repressor [Lucifera butyrica]|uniref:Arginine repressor n=1 Tax=Lucifera butyrica TaxID=1351585 RepID=A0A498R6H4_9FIRM|nr:arginine repressor [Lucifera butyrica]VBB07094.1 arginine repressor [Lucifera butyrica]